MVLPDAPHWRRRYAPLLIKHEPPAHAFASLKAFARWYADRARAVPQWRDTATECCEDLWLHISTEWERAHPPARPERIRVPRHASAPHWSSRYAPLLAGHTPPAGSDSLNTFARWYEQRTQAVPAWRDTTTEFCVDMWLHVNVEGCATASH